MGRREEEDLEEAAYSFDWAGDICREEFPGDQLREDHGDSASTESVAVQGYCNIDSAATTAAAPAADVSRTATILGVGGDTGTEEEDVMVEDPSRERHKAVERERRKSMRELYLSLHALLPHGHSVRQEQSAILDEIIGYIPLAASRLRTLRSNYCNQQATRSVRTTTALPTGSGSTSADSNRRNHWQQHRYHPYSSACSSSSSNTICGRRRSRSNTICGRSSSDVFFSDSQSPIPPLLQEEQDRQIKDDGHRLAPADAADCNITSSTGLSVSATTNQSLPLQLHIQLQQRQDDAPNSLSTGSSTTSAGPSPSVSIRVRGDRVSVSVIDTREPYTSSSSCSSHGLLTMSAVLDELEAHNLQLIRSTHCRDGTKLLHYSESKIPEDMEGTPAELKAKLQHLAHKLECLRNGGNA